MLPFGENLLALPISALWRLGWGEFKGRRGEGASGSIADCPDPSGRETRILTAKNPARQAATKRSETPICSKENSPPLQRWVMAQEDKSSPVRDERSVVPDGTCMAYLAGVPSHEMAGLCALMKTMKLTGERPSADETWNVCVAEGNCAVARRRGEQPEANNPAQNSMTMRLNSIRPVRQRRACIAKYSVA